MLNELDGKVNNGCLVTPVRIQASPGAKIKINSVYAKFSDNTFVTDVQLKDYKNIIEVVDENTGNSQIITVFWLKNYVNRYRLSLTTISGFSEIYQIIEECAKSFSISICLLSKTDT